jgi:hypothetical protein
MHKKSILWLMGYFLSVPKSGPNVVPVYHRLSPMLYVFYVRYVPRVLQRPKRPMHIRNSTTITKVRTFVHFLRSKKSATMTVLSRANSRNFLTYLLVQQKFDFCWKDKIYRQMGFRLRTIVLNTFARLWYGHFPIKFPIQRQKVLRDTFYRLEILNFMNPRFFIWHPYSSFKSLLHLTFPLIRPTILFCHEIWLFFRWTLEKTKLFGPIGRFFTLRFKQIIPSGIRCSGIAFLRQMETVGGQVGEVRLIVFVQRNSNIFSPGQIVDCKVLEKEILI